MSTDHVHQFRQLRDGRPPVCKCGAWLRKRLEIVTDEPRPTMSGGPVAEDPAPTSTTQGAARVAPGDAAAGEGDDRG